MTLPPARDYVEYQSNEEILSLQITRSDAADEPTFLTIAQAMELMYKATHGEASALRRYLAEDRVEEAITIGERIVALLNLTTHSWSVYATMTPLGFLEFRHVLGTGSGFQSISYRLLEFSLGNRIPELAKHHEGMPWAWALIEAEYAKPSVWDEALLCPQTCSIATGRHPMKHGRKWKPRGPLCTAQVMRNSFGLASG
jgi:tryptophan 2,3-dioxygenase